MGNEQIRWARVNNEPFEYAIRHGEHGDEFVKLMNGTCARRPISESHDENLPAISRASHCS